jgi:hypothetical protein
MQRMIDAGISNAGKNIKKPSNITGKCLWCEKELHDDRRWCSTECRDEFAKYAKKG